MPTSTRNQNEDTEFFEPEEEAMFERRGFQTRGIRRQFASVQPISLDTLKVERQDKTFVDPRTLNLPFGPSGMGETGGNGMETVRIQGDEWQTFRYADSVEWMEEEGVEDIATQRQASLETFDFLADANFMAGVEDQSGSEVREGFLSFLKSNIPSGRTLDCTNFTSEYGNTPENIFGYEAFRAISGDLLTRNDSAWDLMIGRHEALSKFNKVQETQSAGRMKYQDLINMGDDNAVGGINDWTVIPSELSLDVIPEGEDPAGMTEDDEPSVDLTQYLGPDEIILIPDLETHMTQVVRQSEMPTPETFGPLDLRQGRKAVDYVWRYSHKFNPENRYPDLKDYVHIKNISELF